VNDEDIMQDKNTARFTDMTMSLVRYQLSLGLRQIVTTPVPPTGSDALRKCLDETIEIVNRQYLQFCDASDPIQRVTLELGRLGEYKLRLLVYHRFLKERNGTTTGNSQWTPARKKYVIKPPSIPSQSQFISVFDPNLK
jgi:hypothetical protein